MWTYTTLLEVTQIFGKHSKYCGIYEELELENTLASNAKLTYHALDLAVKIIALLKDQVQRRKQYVQRANLNFVACAKTNITTIWHVLS